MLNYINIRKYWHFQAMVCFSSPLAIFRIIITTVKSKLLIKLRCILLFAFSALFFMGCKNETSLKNKAEKFVKDSVLKSFNSPKSFELLSTKIDTFKTKDALRNTRYFLKYASNQEDSAKELKKIDSLKLLNQDAITKYQITISYRVENKMGILMVNNMLLFYNPENKSFEVIRLRTSNKYFGVHENLIY